MEPEDLSALSRSIEAAQSRLAQTVSELRHEAQPKVIVGHAAAGLSSKVRSLLVTETGAARLEAVVAGVVAVSAAAAIVLLRRRR